MTPRNINDVIDKITTVLETAVIYCAQPEADQFASTIVHIRKVKESVEFTPPEDMYLRWQQLVNVFQNYMPSYSHPISQRVGAIMRDEE